MSGQSKIEWTDRTWNPLTGCTKVSPGCDHCYAKTMHERFNGPGSFDTITLHPERLDQPLRWRKPAMVFVNSMSDLFEKDVPDEYIQRVFSVMGQAERHTFQILTKRPGRMRSLLSSPDFFPRVRNDRPWPLPNVWLGVSVENEQWMHRVRVLRETPAAVRFLSCEPLIGPITSLYRHLPNGWGEGARWNPTPSSIGTTLPTIDWVIAGGESGPGARAMHPDWARSLRDQCVTAGVPFLFKQWGEWAHGANNVRLSKHRYQYKSIRFRPTGELYTPADVGNPETGYGAPGMTSLLRVGKKAAGRELDGRTWDEYPGLAA